MTIEIIDRDDVPECYQEMLQIEQHHDHEIIKDDRGVLRWREDPFVSRFVDACNLNYIVMGFHDKGTDKNCEIYRELYRRMGYSLSGYMEIFYWDWNNEAVNDYVPGAR